MYPEHNEKVKIIENVFCHRWIVLIVVKTTQCLGMVRTNFTCISVFSIGAVGNMGILEFALIFRFGLQGNRNVSVIFMETEHKSILPLIHI